METQPTPVLDYRGPTLTPEESLPPRRRFDWLNIILQVGHRAAALAMFVVLVAVAGAKTGMFAGYPIARSAFILADLAAVCGVGGWYLATVQHKPRREAIGVIVFSLIIAIASLIIMIKTRA
jgi:hypothetical protein